VAATASYRKHAFVIGAWEPGGPSEELIEADAEAMTNGLAAALLAAETNDWKHVWFVTNTKGDIDRGPAHDALVKLLGASSVRTLRSGGTVVVGDCVGHHAAVPRSLSNPIGESVLAIYPTMSILDALESLHRAHSLTVVPHHYDISKWVKRSGAIDPVAGQDAEG
jgi:hypothetical protein